MIYDSHSLEFYCKVTLYITFYLSILLFIFHISGPRDMEKRKAGWNMEEGVQKKKKRQTLRRSASVTWIIYFYIITSQAGATPWCKNPI